MSNVTVLGEGSLGGGLGRESGALVHGIGALIRETLQSSLALSTMHGHKEKMLAMNRGRALTRT